MGHVFNACVEGLRGLLELEEQQSGQLSLTPKNPPGSADDQYQACRQCYNCCKEGCEER